MKKIKHESTWDQSGLSCTLRVHIDAEEVTRLLNKEYASYRNNVSYKGFRKGKLTNRLVSLVLNDGARAALAHELTGNIIKELGDAAMAEHPEPCITPELESTPEVMKEGEDFSFVLRYEVYPELPEVSLENISVRLARCTLEEADIDELVAGMKAKAVGWTSADRPAAHGDRVSFRYYAARADVCETDCVHEHGHEVEGSAAIVLEEGEVAQAVLDVLLGVIPGDVRSVSIDSAADWLRYLQIHQDVDSPLVEPLSLKITEVSVSQTQPFDASAWSSLGYFSPDEEALREEIREEYEEALAVLIQNYAYEDLKPKLIALYDFPLPPGMLERESKRLRKVVKDASVDIDTLAEHNVRLSLILRHYNQKHPQSVDRESVRNYLSAVAPTHGMFRSFFIHQVFENEGMLRAAAAEVLERKLLELCLSSVQREERVLTYAELKEHMGGV